MSGLRLYNTLTRTKEDFVPLDAGNVRMYVCGPTVYDFAHIGNARPAIVFDVLFRLLRHLYGENHVTYVRNVTDVDDKINARAHEVAEAKGIPIEAAREEITAITAKQYDDDVAALGCLKPTREPRATEHIRQMVQMIEHLIKMGHAYETSGHVLYDVSSKSDYGKLARRSLDEMIAGARVDVAPYKQNPMDFVLWKPSMPELPGWHSPWGRGRPGWHIECSAMADALLGQTFDIHGGGIDLLFPHHENEIAQSEGAHGNAPPARVWMHNGFLQVEGEKMSKSLGNFVTIRELLRTEKFGGRRWPGDVLRLAMLQTHYREPIDWTVARLHEAAAKLDKWRSFASDRVDNELDHERFDFVLNHLSNDMNTPAAFAAIDEIVFGGRFHSESRYTVYRLLKVLGFKGPLSRAVKVSNMALEVSNYLQKFPEACWLALAQKELPEGNVAHAVANLTVLKLKLQEIIPLIERSSSLSEINRLLDIRRDNLFPPWRTEDLSFDTVRRLDSILTRLNISLHRIGAADWHEYDETVRREPFLSSGKRRAPTDLIFSIVHLADIVQHTSAVNKQILNFALLESLQRKYKKYEIELPIEIQMLIDARNAARKAKNFKESDRIRDDLLAKGIQLKDNPDGTTSWEVKR